MRILRLAVAVAVLTFTAAATYATPCGYNPVINAPANVESLSTGNVATFSANASPSYVDWSITNGTITAESNSVTFTAGRSGNVELQLTVGDGQTCADTVMRSIPIVHSCVVTPKSRVISETYVGGQTVLEVEANCEWDVIVPGQPNWVRVIGPTTVNGNGTVTFEFDPVPFDGSVQSAMGRATTIYVGDKDMSASQAGWEEVGTDIIRDGKADLLWRNSSTRVNWMQSMNGLTAGTSSTVAPWDEFDVRIVNTRTEFGVWKIFWRNFASAQNYEQPMAGLAPGSAVPINTDDANWRVVNGGIFNAAVNSILRRNLVTGELRVTRTAFDQLVWTEADANWQIVATEDFDGDLLLDILWRNTSTGTVFLILNPVSAPAAQVVHYEPDLNWQIAAAGDVNADGRADIAWRNSADGRVWIQAMDGFRTIGGNVVWTDADPNWSINGMADFDGNGSKDLLWRNSSTGVVFGILLDASLNVMGSGVVHTEPDANWKIVAPNTAAAAINGNH